MDEAVIGAPYSVTEELISHFRVSIVVQGASEAPADVDGQDPNRVCSVDCCLLETCVAACLACSPAPPPQLAFSLPQVPKAKGIFRTVDSNNPLSEKIIVQRIIDHRRLYEERNRKKELKKIEEEKEKARIAAEAAAQLN